ncbi:MAG: hypothetical protein ABIG91_00495 [Patescibacteria group bacterium]
MNKPQAELILENLYRKAFSNVKANKTDFSSQIDGETLKELNLLIEKSVEQKAVITVLITSLTKKMDNPRQDIRLHKAEFKGGYSGRGYDTRFITPFLKNNFPKIAMKESGWLTRSIEQSHPFDVNFPGKIRSLEAKKSFLDIIDKIESGKIFSEQLLEYLLTLLIKKFKEDASGIKTLLNINDESMIIKIIEKMHSHFATRKSSFLPVMAVYSIYQVVTREISRYKGKKLLSLKGHTTADTKSHSVGDIEIVNENGKLFEGLEIKHNLKIDYYIVLDVINKIKGKRLKRFYILTTASPEIKEGEVHKINAIIAKFKDDEGCEIVVNGVLPTIRYYLRLINTPKDFVLQYTNNLIYFYENSSLILKDHIDAWKTLSSDLKRK